MGLISIIGIIIQIFIHHEEIWEAIKKILDAIRSLFTRRERVFARRELRRTLEKYKDLDKNDKHQVSAKAPALQAELDTMLADLEARIQVQTSQRKPDAGL
jgi:quinol monooxygenase YgiN